MSPKAGSLGAALGDAALRLAGCSPTPHLDAQLLLAQLLGWERARLLGRLDEALPEEIGPVFAGRVARRAAGEPVAYLLGLAWFHGLQFTVGPEVLIPRPETELLVDWGLAWLRGRVPQVGPDLAPLRVLDVGTGSGAIVVALAVAWSALAGTGPSPAWWASDLSREALALAAANAARLCPAAAIRFHHADLWPEPGEARTFHLLLANLPYIGTEERASLAPDVVDYEPHLALFAGPQGLDQVRRLIDGLPRRLAPGGGVALEIGYRQGEAVKALLQEALPGAVVQVHRDLAGLDRMVTAQC